MRSSLDWMHLIDFYGRDKRLNVYHLALLYAIVRLGISQGENELIRVSRSKLMEISHIDTIPTFHKYFKQLQEFGYINYNPSYHPGYRSTVELKKNLY